MAKKAAPKSSPAPKTPAAQPAAAPPAVTLAEQPIAESAVRKTVAPPAISTKKPAQPLPYDHIAERAYHISRSGHGGSEYDNWLRAEAELKNESI